MKLFCENIEKIPNTATVLTLTKDERLVLEFPEKALDNAVVNKVIDNLAKKLPIIEFLMQKIWMKKSELPYFQL